MFENEGEEWRESEHQIEETYGSWFTLRCCFDTKSQACDVKEMVHVRALLKHIVWNADHCGKVRCILMDTTGVSLSRRKYC